MPILTLPPDAPLAKLYRTAWSHEDGETPTGAYTYRYRLHRSWGEGPNVVFLMLNPSTASGLEDDPTIRRCVRFAKDRGYGSLTVVNVFAFRTPDPRVLASILAGNPDHRLGVIGKDNDELIQLTLAEADALVCAWGASPLVASRRDDLRALLARFPGKVYCLGRTKEGHPRHPLYVPAAQPFEEFSL